MENLVQLIRVLQHRDSEHQITINSLGEKLRESEIKRAEDDAKYSKVMVFLEQLKSYRIKVEKVHLPNMCWLTKCYDFYVFDKNMSAFLIQRSLPAHPAERALTSDWSLKSFIMVVCEKFGLNL